MTPIKGFLPDSDPNSPGIITACSNIIPFEAGMKGAPSPLETTVDALAAECRGAVVATKLDGSRRVIAGTQTKLYELSGTAWTDRTDTGLGSYTGSTESRWSFAQFGDTTVATNLVDDMQSSSSGAFATIDGAPKAKIVISASNNFVVAFNTIDDTYGTSPDRWWCCAQADETDWTPSVTTLATTGRLVATEGPILAALSLGDNPVAYKSKGIYVGLFSGIPEVFQWNLASSDVGAVGQDAVCAIGGTIHFIVADDGFWLFDGTRPVPVGVGKVRKWFLDNSNPAYRYRTQCIYDKQSNLVRVYFPSSASSGTCDRCLVYHVTSQEWGLEDATIEAALAYIAPGVTIHGLDSIASTIDALPNIPIDSQYWLSGGQTPSYFNSSHQIVSLNGECGSSSITTCDVGDDDRVSMISRVRVRYTQSPTTATATGYYKMNEGDALSIGASGSINDGKFDLRQSGRFHRVRVEMTGDHKITGYDVGLIPAGGR
jgi:hypothetical protein